MDIVPFEGTMIDGIRKWKKKETGECRIERGGKVESQREERAHSRSICLHFATLWGAAFGKGGQSANVN